MKKNLLTTAVVAALGIQGTAFAASMDDRLSNTEKRIQYLEKRISDQEQTQRDEAASAIEIGGVVEVEMTSGDGASGLGMATAELGLVGKVNDEVTAEVVLLNEGDTDSMNLDTALINIAPAGNVSYTVGQFVVPFGAYETNMVSDPMTLEMGETGEHAFQLSYEADAISAGLYLFNGEHGADKIDNMGFNFGYAGEGFNVGFGYIDDIAETDGIAGVAAAADKVAGQTLSASYEMGSISFGAEYVAAASEFAAGELTTNTAAVTPSATNIEVAYAFELAGKGATFAVGSQSSTDAEDIGLDKSRTMMALSVGILENTSLAVEMANATAYDDSDTSTVTVLLGVEF